MHGSAVSFLAPALGFASNLSHTIIREQREDDEHSLRSDDSSSTNISITDEELAQRMVRIREQNEKIKQRRAVRFAFLA